MRNFEAIERGASFLDARAAEKLQGGPVASTATPSRENQPGDIAPRVELVNGADIKPESVSWLWDGWLAVGKFHVMAGAPGTGKTTIALALAATLTTGGRWPDRTRAKPRDVLIWSGEDDPKDTLAPRLLSCGADMRRIHFVGGVFDLDGKRPFDPATDIGVLQDGIARAGDVGLLVIDPIVSAVAADSHKNGEVRRGLQPLVDLGLMTGCAILGISHFSKGTSNRDPVERVTGSIAFGALARVVLATAKINDEGNGSWRLLARAKSNIGPDTGGFRYDLEQAELQEHPGVFASRILWGDTVEGSARELLATAETPPDPDGGESVASVATWLQDLLSEEGGRVDRRDVMRAANAMGHKERTVHRAREKLGLVVKQSGFGKDKRSLWTWPDSPIPASIVPIVPSLKAGTHGTNGGTHGQTEPDFEVF